MRPHIQDVALIEKIFRYSFYKIEMEQTLFYKAFSVFSSIKIAVFRNSEVYVQTVNKGQKAILTLWHVACSVEKKNQKS